MPNKLTDAEIKKALECCNTEYEDYQCPHCPLLHKGCKKALIQDALDLINRQEAEIEKLKATVDSFTDIGKLYSEIKAEAYKEFAEKVKNKARIVCTEHGEAGFVVDVLDIDNLLNELVGDENGKEK